MRKLKLNGESRKHLDKAMAHQHYRTEMIKSFEKNFEMIEKAGMEELHKSFLKTGKGCKHLTAKEYADLAVKTFAEVKQTR